jgi:pyruvate/2-oxoglutarate dehydrogenase complex dihydrolipoamide acyltransferase (E2) component
MMVGKIEERAIVVDGQVVPARVIPIRYSYDERIDDGLNARFGIDAVNRALEAPYEHFGCLAEDGSDALALDRFAPSKG